MQIVLDKIKSNPLISVALSNKLREICVEYSVNVVLSSIQFSVNGRTLTKTWKANGCVVIWISTKPGLAFVIGF